ncbi:uncharacterized protein C8R40DRAFT_157909 [Lentinula edodes]|uniref:uncharacterized protein n=1 Tax=Lentinula edodes TaxID=5353 RepID=UPI001E8D0356|nr:uncharacterized protein C8R40DRAFT_157909 [Lentinula edodes]KAH7876226.1 hypothetical protein C8R40DRAFT_157909 [Lentinula edodes]
MRLTLAPYFLTLGVSLFYVVCAMPVLSQNQTQALQPHSSTLRISFFPPGHPNDPQNSSKFGINNLSARSVVIRFLNQMRYRPHAHLDRAHVTWENHWFPTDKHPQFIVDDDDVDGRCHSFCLAVVDLPSKEQYHDPNFQIHGTLATANSENWEELHMIHTQNRPTRK